MKTITLPFDWNDAKNYHSRFVTSLEGFQIDLLNFTKVFLNKRLLVEGNKVSFQTNQAMIAIERLESNVDNQNNSIIRLSGIGEYKSHVIQNSYNRAEDKIYAYFHDVVAGGLPFVNKDLEIRTFGYSDDAILDIMERSGTIYRATKNTFIVIDREDFYKWIGQELLTRDLFIDRLRKHLNRNKTRNEGLNY